MTYSHEQLILADTGEFDWTFIKRHAVVRAQREFGGCAPPVVYVRNEIRYLQDIAAIMRKRWRDAHGLPDDTEYVAMNVPTWGASGDGFGR
jgi:hypothetical protein